MKRKIVLIARTCLALCVAMTSFGCNTFTAFDSPHDTPDAVAAAHAKANAGDCIGARDLLVNINPPTNDSLVGLGWAYMCIAGATAANIANSVYNFKSTTGNYTVVGTLARVMVPMDAIRIQSVNYAVSAMASITDDRSNIEVAIAELIQAAGFLAQQAANNGDSSTLTQADISPNAGCATALVNCTAGMSDGDVSSFFNSISIAATRLSATGASDLVNLATYINNNAATGNAGRYFIYNNIIPQ